MRNHHARVVLAACLVAATAAAQAPAILTGSSLLEASTVPGNELESPHEWGLGDWRTGRESLGRAPQEPVDYSLRGMFMTNHGEFMSRRERYDPQVKLRARVLPEIGVDHEPGSFNLLDYQFDVETPAYVAPDGYLKFGAYYGDRRYDFSRNFGTNGNGPNGNLGDETLTNTGVKLGFGVFLDDNILLEVETDPGLWSDLDGGLHHNDFDFPSSALLTFRTMPNLFFKVGARYNQIFEDAPWLPYLGVSWEIVEGLRFDLLAPETVELSFWPNPSTGFLLGSEVVGAEYHVRTSEATGSQRANARVQELFGYVGLMHRFTDHVSLTGRTGAVFTGRYDLTSGAATYDRVEGQLDTGWFAELMLGFDF